MPKKRQTAPSADQADAMAGKATPAMDSNTGFNIKSDHLRLIPFFSGCPSENFDEFLLDFEEIAVLSRWNEQEKILALRQKLTAAAKVFIRQQVAPINSYSDLITLLKKQYVKNPDATTLLQDFLNFSQPPTMSVAEYTNRAVNLSYTTFRRNELEPPVEEANRKAMLKAMLLKNLAPEVRRGVIASNPKTVEDIIEQATLEERAFEATRIPEGNTQRNPGVFAIATSAGPDKNSDQVEDLKRKVDELTRQLEGLRSERKSRQNPLFCIYCRQHHYGRCWEAQQRFGENRGRFGSARGSWFRQPNFRQFRPENYPVEQRRREVFDYGRGRAQGHYRWRGAEQNFQRGGPNARETFAQETTPKTRPDNFTKSGNDNRGNK